MYSDDEEVQQVYTVLVNDEEQYSLWPSHKDIPAGWRSVGVTGSKAECTEYVDKVWTDITPLSVRQRLAQQAG
jgi:MbtH protein